MMKKQAKHSVYGFTLIELLVVLVLIGIILTFAVLATGDFGKSRKFRMQSEHLLDNLHYAQMYALLTPCVIRLNIQNKRTLLWQQLGPDQKWQTIKGDKILKAHSLPKDLQLSDTQPYILISPEGRIENFYFELSDQKQTQRAWLHNDQQKGLYVETE